MNRLLKIGGIILIVILLGYFAINAIMKALNFETRVEDGELIITNSWSFTEDQMNSGDNSVFQFAETDFITNANYDIREGDILISGDILCEDESRAEGQMTVTMGTTAEGFLDVAVTEVTADCELDQSMIDEARNDLASTLAEAASDAKEDGATVTFTDVTLSHDKLDLAIEIRTPLEK